MDENEKIEQENSGDKSVNELKDEIKALRTFIEEKFNSAPQPEAGRDDFDKECEKFFVKESKKK